MENKIHPLVIRNVQFKNILPLNENVIRKIRCTKRTSADGKSDKFEVTHITGQGEIVLSTAEVAAISREASDNSLHFSEACKCVLFRVIIPFHYSYIWYCITV